MGYRIESIDAPEFVKAVNKLPSIFRTEEIPCPTCGGFLAYVDSSEGEEYTAKGTFESGERYYCDDCGTFADVVQVYAPVERKVKVYRDVYDD